MQTINQFDSKVRQKLFGLFKNGENDFRSIVARIQGQSLNPQQIRSALSPYITNLTDPSHANIAMIVVTSKMRRSAEELGMFPSWMVHIDRIR